LIFVSMVRDDQPYLSVTLPASPAKLDWGEIVFPGLKHASLSRPQNICNNGHREIQNERRRCLFRAAQKTFCRRWRAFRRSDVSTFGLSTQNKKG